MLDPVTFTARLSSIILYIFIYDSLCETVDHNNKRDTSYFLLLGGVRFALVNQFE